MDESENQNVEEPQPKIDTPFKKHFYTVTPLSKYLAMALFIALPFLGFWVGLRVQVNTETNSNIELKTDTGSQVKVTKEGDEDNNISSEKTNFNDEVDEVGQESDIEGFFKQDIDNSYSVSFKYPYLVTWSEQNTDFSLVDVKVGSFIIPSSLSRYIEGPSGESYRTGDIVNAIQLSIKARATGFNDSFYKYNIISLNSDFRLILNEEGDMRASSIVHLGDTIRLNESKMQEVLFIIGEIESEYDFSTGGESNVFFNIKLLDNNSIEVENISAETRG